MPAPLGGSGEGAGRNRRGRENETRSPDFVISMSTQPSSDKNHPSRNGLVQNRLATWTSFDFPARPPFPCAAPGNLVSGLGRRPREILKSRDYVAVFDSQAE